VKYFSKNIPNWNKNELIEELKKFRQIYKSRPIQNNINGMLFPHMFATYFILKKINPSFVIESGVFKGQSTWLIEKTLPRSKILSIDIDLNQRKYISNNAKYSNIDFKDQDFSNIPKDTLVFFDDHVDHYERLKQAKFFNIKNIILEDNYKEGKGDFYTIKHSYQNVGFNHNYTALSNIKTLYIFLFEILKKLIIKNYYFPKDKIISRLRDHQKNKNDFKNLEKIIGTYYEFPPLYKNCEHSTKPILENNEINFEISKHELLSYNYITFIKLL
jgi:hypothetical protein